VIVSIEPEKKLKIKREVTKLMRMAVAMRHAHPADYDARYKELQNALYPLVELKHSRIIL